MSTWQEHIKRLRDEMQAINADGHLTNVDDNAAANDIELSIYELQKAFESELDKEP